MRKVPELRFDGFDGEWEEKKLSDIGKISAGGDVDKKKIRNKGLYPVIANGDSNNGIIGYYDDYYKISEPVVTISARGNIGTAVPRNYPFTPVIRVLTFISENNIYFMSEVINRLRIFNESSGVSQLTSPQFGAYKIFITKLSEQEKIGDLFKKIDDLIEIQEGKVTKMEDFKKSMLQKMFPKKDKLVPEFRFYGFDGEWEKKKISDIGKISAGGDVDKKKISNKGRYPVIANGDSNNGIIGYYEDHYKISEPAVTISARGNIGTAVARNYPFTPVIRVLTLISDNNIYFMSEAINRLRIFNESSGVPQLTSPQFGGYNIFMTKLSEQDKIGQFFKNLDTQIENEEKLLESYKMMKKSLLQKMFV